MASTTVNPDLARSRAQATFDPLQLTYFLYDGPEKTRRKRFLQNLAIKECEEQKFKRDAEMSREEKYEESVRKSTYAYRRMAELGLTDQLDLHFFREIFLDEPHPFFIHSVFETTVRKLGAEEQRRKWLPLIRNFQAVGTYAQTELGHGTFLRGLETTATYDPKTKEFVIHTPTITAAKFWPGGLGKTSNYCVVMAKLYTQGRDCGMQSFITQLRDLETHQPLPGITVGDIGTKFGYGSMDNGFLMYDNYRIPRENMLMRYAQVLEDGTFIEPKNDRLVYGSMTLIRAQIVAGTSRALAKSVTIATRYSAVRKQSEINSGAGEVQVIDFQTQQFKLFPIIASALALTIAARKSLSTYSRVSAQIESGALEELPVLHALSSGLKSFSAWEMMWGIEQCRTACGGHGYLNASGLPKIYANEVPAVTYEGENTVLSLQTARYLMKAQNRMEQGGNLPSMLAYLKTTQSTKSKLTEKLELEELVAAFEHRSAVMIAEASKRMKEQLGKGLKQAEAWNSSSQMLSEAAMAFCHAFVVRAFVQTVSESRLEPSLTQVLVQLCQLYALHGITRYLGQFTRGGYLSEKQVTIVQSGMLDLLAAIKPNAVALVDAFDFPDRVLDSELGRYDGNVYEAIMAYARNSKLNRTEVNEAFYKYQKPFVDSMKTNLAPQSRL